MGNSVYHHWDLINLQVIFLFFQIPVFPQNRFFGSQCMSESLIFEQQKSWWQIRFLRMPFPSISNSKLLYHSRIKRGQEIYIIFLLCFLVKSKLGGHAYVLPENHSHRVFRKECAMCQRGRGHWDVYYTGPLSFIIKLA